MLELPCPLCGHLHTKPNHGSKFKCRGCTEWLELSKDKTCLQDHTARKAADLAKANDWWHQQALIKQRKLGTDYDTAMKSVRRQHNENVEKMRDKERLSKFFPPEKYSTPVINSPLTVSTPVTQDDFTSAPWD